MMELILKSRFTLKDAVKLDQETRGQRPDGLYDLIYDLAVGVVRSYDRSRMYYLAGMLTERQVEFDLVDMGDDKPIIRDIAFRLFSEIEAQKGVKFDTDTIVDIEHEVSIHFSVNPVTTALEAQRYFFDKYAEEQRALGCNDAATDEPTEEPSAIGDKKKSLLS